MAKLRYACIGVGGIANKKHIGGYQKLPEVEVCAVCDVSEDTVRAISQKYGVPKYYTDYREMLEKENLDIVSVCTPNFTHMPIIVDALRAGVHVHCEKPLAMTAAEVETIIHERDVSSRQVMVALNNRFSDVSQLVTRLVDDGFFGEIYHAKCGWVRSSGIPGIGKWYTEKRLSGGGCLIDLGVHFIDLALHFMGYPDPVSVFGTTYSKFGKNGSRIRVGYKSVPGGVFDVEDMATGLVRLSNGATINFDFSWASNIAKETKFVSLMGTKGGMTLENDELKLYEQHSDACFTAIPDVKTIAKGSDECAHFVKSIISGIPNSCTAEQAHTLMTIIDGVYKSAEIGGETKLSCAHAQKPYLYRGYIDRGYVGIV